VPTVGGQVRFHTRYDGNCLVNAMAVGLAETDTIFYSAASGGGMPTLTAVGKLLTMLTPLLAR
jgi:phosphoribosylformylglycinamidine (FGAM) synthase-like enzyme